MAASPPVFVDRVQPAVGPPAGGTYAIVRAAGLGEGAQVQFGDAAAKVLKVVDPTRMVVQVPKGALGPVDVRVTLASGAQGTLVKGFSYVEPTKPAPALAKVIPSTALAGGGTALALQGAALQPGVQLFLGWQPTAHEYINGNAISAISPPLPVGANEVAVTNPDGQSALLPVPLQVADKVAGAQGPQLTGLAPPAGSVGGNTQVTLTGSGLDKGAVLLWGGEHLAALSVESATKATLLTPSHSAGVVDAVIVNPDGQTAILSDAFVYQLDVPAVYAVDPPTGPLAGGNTVAVSGYGFDDGTVFSIGGKPCEPATVKDSGSATCKVPAGDVAGAVAVAVTSGKGLKGQLPKGYTYAAPAPKAEILAVQPANGPPAGGIAVLVKAKHLPAGAEVWFGSEAAAPFAPFSPDLAAVTLPKGKAGPVDVSIKVGGQVVAVAPLAFTYDEPPVPAITKVSPAVGPVAGGIAIAIEGTSPPAQPSVSFGGQKASVVAAAGTAVVAVLPPGKAGPVDVVVSGQGGDVTAKAGFTYEAAAAPQVSAVVPAVGPVGGGIVVVVQGKNLSPQGKVLFGGKAAPTTYMSGTDGIGVLLPPNDAGAVDVVVQTPDQPDAVLKAAFTYQVAAGGGPKLAVGAVAPAQSPTSGGAWAIVKGANIPVGAKVFFGAKESKDVLILAGDLLSARVPAADGPGAVDVIVTDPASQQSAKLAAGFTYWDPKGATSPAPKIESIKPGIGPSQGGTLALIDGKQFAEGALVFFGGRPASGVLRVSATQLTATSPPSPPGPATAMVVHPDGQWSELPDAFVYTVGTKPNVTVQSALPAQGSAAGGTDVVLNGSGFAPGLLLFIDGVPHPAAIKTNKTAALQTPPHPPGLAQIAVTAADGWTATLPAGFLFVVEAPFVATVQPGWSPLGGGQELVITGQGFHPKAKVAIGAVEVPVTQASAGALKVASPPGKKGKADVTVTNPDGLFDVLEQALDYTDVAPGKELAVARIQPATSPLGGGGWAVVEGNGFVTGAQVLIGNALCGAVELVDDKHLQVEVPKGVVGPADVQVVVPDVGKATAKNALFYYDPLAPGGFAALLGVEPGIGPVQGGTIALVHVSPASTDMQVYFGGVPAKVLGADGQANLVVEAPPHAAGAVDVAAVPPNGKAAVAVAAFTYYQPAKGVQVPSLAAVKPSGGSTAGGDAVVLTGSSLQPGTLGFVGYRPLGAVVVQGGDGLSGLTAPHPSGLVDVAVTRPDGFSATLKAAYAYAAPAPKISTVFPAQGPVTGDATVVLAGTGFVQGAVVRFGDKDAKKTTFVAPTVLLAVTPPVAAAGAVDVVVDHPDGKSAIAAAAYAYTDKPAGTPPQPTAVTPPKGPWAGGSAVVIWGDGFKAGAQVLFGNQPAAVKLVTPTTITVLTPAHPLGPADVTVLNPDGQGGALGNAFQYISPASPAPKLYGVTPNLGPEKGGTPLVVTGDKLTPGGVGLVGWRPLQAFTVLNTSIATGTTPFLPAGKHPVAVTNGDGQTAILDAAFSSIGAPQIDSFTPVLGPIAGGTLVTVAGKHFAAGASVSFGGKKAKDVTVLSEFVLKVVAPASDPGPAALQIVNADGQQATSAATFQYVAPPKVTEVFAPQGPTTGGVPVLVIGDNLIAGSVVRFGAVVAKGAQASDGTALLVTTPPLAAGPHTVAVDSPTGESAQLKDAYTAVDPAAIGKAPTFEKAHPATGPASGATWGILKGADLQNNARAVFGPRPAVDNQSLDAGAHRFVAPPSDTTGTVALLLLHPDGSFGEVKGGFTYTDPLSLGVGPKVSAVDPSSGSVKGGEAVSLLGTGLDAEGLVFFGGLPGSGLKAITGGLQVLTPAQAAQSVLVRHTDVEGRTVLASGPFLVVPPPVPTSVTPGEGPAAGGAFVTIAGKQFATGVGKTVKVLFCAQFAQNADCASVPAGEVSVKSSGEILVATPPHLPGLVDVAIVNPDGQAGVLAQAYLYRPPPKILAVDPAIGSTMGGTLVTLTGTGFQPAAAVQVGKADASEVQVVSATKITFKAPPGAAGPAAITVSNVDKGVHVLNGGFVYVAPPKIVAVFPSLGPETGGTDVTIQGESFVTGVKGSKVEIGGKAVPEADLTVKSAEIIQIKTPPGTGPAAIKVINPDGQVAVKSGAFVYIPLVPAPKITYTMPKFAPTGGGTQVSVYGQGFLEGLQVAFGNDAVGWTNGANVSVLNNGTLAMVTTPPMSPGVFSVKATNSDGQQGVLADGFEFTTALALPGLGFGGVVPNRGPIKGGYTITLYGQGFQNGVTVHFGTAATASWVEAPKVVRLGPTLLTVTVPDWSGPAKVDVRVVNPVVGGKTDEVVAKGVWNFGQAVVITTRGHRLPPDVSQADNQSVIFDANGDGLNDILVMKYSSWENSRDDLYIQVKDENGKPGKFTDQSVLLPTLPNYPWGNRWDPVALDVDKDGDVDVLFRNNPSWQNLLLYRNQGDGSMKAENLGSFTGFNSTQRMIPGDLNCDGIDDLFLVVHNGQKYVLIGNGKGGYTAKTGILPAHTEPSMSAAVGDVDKDGDNDVVVVNDQAFQNRLYLNNCNNVAAGQPWSFADAQYGSGKNFPISGFNSRDVALADVNGDQWLDVVLVNWGQSTRIYLNNGGNFVNDIGALFPQTEALSYSARVTLADVDVDGDLDMTVLKYRGSSGQYWPNLYLSDKAQGGGGAFTDVSKVNLPGFRGEDCTDVRVGDLNGDKLPDMMLTRTNHQDWLLINNGYAEDKAMVDANRVPKGSFANNTLYGVPETTLDHTSGAAGDIDGDGDPDLVMVTNLSGYGQSLRVWVNDGTGAFFDESTARSPDVGCHAQHVRLVDLNGDKDLDILIACYYNSPVGGSTGGLRELANDGKGKFKDVSTINMPGAYASEYWLDIAAGDLDGDGDADAIAVGTNGNATRTLINGGDPFNTDGAYFFVNNALLNVPWTGVPMNSVLIADLSGDGQNDVYIGTDQQNILLHNKGGGKMTNVSVSHLPSLNDDTRRVLAVDVDLDKDVDLFCIDNGPIRLNLSELDHKYSDITASHLPSGLGGNGQGGAIADLDLDGYPDIVSANWNQQNVLMLNQSAGAFANFTSQMPPDSDYSRDIVIADFDLDGRPDVFSCNAGQNRIYWNETPIK